MQPGDICVIRGGVWHAFRAVYLYRTEYRGASEPRQHWVWIPGHAPFAVVNVKRSKYDLMGNKLLDNPAQA